MNAVIVGFVRSAFTPAHRGALSKVRPDDLVAEVVKALVKKTGVNPNDIEDLKLGCAFPEGEQGLNLAKLVTFLADLPRTVGGVTINRFCGSSMQGVHDAAGAIAAGAGEVFICAGVESMSRVPMAGFNPLPNPDLYERYPQAYESMGITAENVAKKYKISRKEQDEFALTSQQKAEKAGLAEEIVPVAGVDRDGCVRPDTSMEDLGKLQPAFLHKGSVTAGTSSPLTDGAAAVLVISEAYAKKHKLPILARVKSFAISGCAPEIMGIGPVEASRKAMARAGITADQLDVIELNEAFAAQSIACIRDLNLPKEKINMDGGAIALGHPLGATGARIVGKAAQLLKKKKGRYALATQCIGGGQGIATILERVE